MVIGGPEVLFAFLVPLGVLGVLALVAGVAFRPGGPDPRGRRPLALYLLAVMLVTLFTAVFSVFQAASAVVRAAVDPLPHGLVTFGGGWVTGEGGVVAVPASPPPEFPAEVPEEELLPDEIPPEAILPPFLPDPPAAEVAKGLITAILAGGVFVFHLRRLLGLIATEVGGG